MLYKFHCEQFIWCYSSSCVESVFYYYVSVELNTVGSAARKECFYKNHFLVCDSYWKWNSEQMKK